MTGKIADKIQNSYDSKEGKMGALKRQEIARLSRGLLFLLALWARGTKVAIFCSSAGFSSTLELYQNLVD